MSLAPGAIQGGIHDRSSSSKATMCFKQAPNTEKSRTVLGLIPFTAALAKARILSLFLKSGGGRGINVVVSDEDAPLGRLLAESVGPVESLEELEVIAVA